MEKLFVDLGKKSYDILFSDSFNGFAKAMSDIKAPKKLLVVTDSNIAAQGLYKKYGFDIIGERKRYYSDNGEDAWIMTKSFEPCEE